MNVGSFLHKHKQDRDSKLLLPLVPVYQLPHHEWYFSSPQLIPLRKKKQNSSPSYFLQRSSQNQVFKAQNIFAVLEKNNYFSSKLKHAFELVKQQHCNRSSFKSKIKCSSCQQIKDRNAILFEIRNQLFFTALNKNKNKSPRPKDSTKHQNINWFQFTRHIVNESLGEQFFFEDHLYLYKNNPNTQIFHVTWSKNCIIFGSSIKVNQHMKAKTVQFVQSLSKSINKQIWKIIEGYVEAAAGEVNQFNQFRDQIKNKMQCRSFKLWLWKNNQNNEVYVGPVSNLILKATSCIIYPQIDFKKIVERKQDIINEQIVNEVDQYFTNRIKSYSLFSKSYQKLTINSQEESRQKLKILALNQSLEKVENKGLYNKNKVDLKNIQCCCCNGLIEDGDSSQITAKHIEQIRYMRQLKKVRLNFESYDFVSVCRKCYSVYLSNVGRQNRDMSKKTVNFYDYKRREDSKEISNICESRQKSIKMTKNSSKKLIRNGSHKTRAKSQLNTTKEYSEHERNTKISCSRQEDRTKPKIPISKHITTHTCNTETLVALPYSFPKSNSYKIKTNRNLINQTTNSTENIGKIAHDSSEIKAQIIRTAINEYEQISRPSFKRLVHKNHRLLRKEEIQNRKKSVHSFLS